jgi:hypothetical protein
VSMAVECAMRASQLPMREVSRREAERSKAPWSRPPELRLPHLDADRGFPGRSSESVRRIDALDRQSGRTGHRIPCRFSGGASSSPTPTTPA